MPQRGMDFQRQANAIYFQKTHTTGTKRNCNLARDYFDDKVVRTFTAAESNKNNISRTFFAIVRIGAEWVGMDRV
jgi:hypothetical protein